MMIHLTGAPASAAGGALDDGASGGVGDGDSGGVGSDWLAEADGSAGLPGSDDFPGPGPDTGPGSDGLAGGFPADGLTDAEPGSRDGPGADSLAPADGDPELSSADGRASFRGIPPPAMPGCHPSAPPADCGPSAPAAEALPAAGTRGLESSCARTLIQPVTAMTGRSRTAAVRARTGTIFTTATSAETRECRAAQRPHAPPGHAMEPSGSVVAIGGGARRTRTAAWRAANGPYW